MIAQTGSSTCPVAMLEQYMARTGMRWEDDCYVFEHFRKQKMEKPLQSQAI